VPPEDETRWSRHAARHRQLLLCVGELLPADTPSRPGGRSPL